jgi:phosphate transport system ATP-binding protein
MKTGFTLSENLRSDIRFNKIKLKTENANLYYGRFHCLRDVTLGIPERAITSIIGPSGCGKSSFLRIFNRMNDLIPGTRVEGKVEIEGQSIYEPAVDIVGLRKRIGMVFQKPNPFPMSVYDNIAFGPRQHRRIGKSDLDQVVEASLNQSALWEEVKDKLGQPALSLSSAEQQRLCIARVLAVEPEVILMDEPCSALDPIATLKIEDLMRNLAERYTIVIVTHNMQQAARVSDLAAFFMMAPGGVGELVEFGPTAKIFTNPDDKRTEDYITGHFG